jgi:lipopolysaccharide transport system ATP-binding protein
LEPEILIVDEVLAVGDAEFQKKCLGKMQDVSRGGRTVLFVSHNLSAVSTLCGKCAFLESGKLLRLDSTEACIAFYTNRTNNIGKPVATINKDGYGFYSASVHRNQSSGISDCETLDASILAELLFDCELPKSHSLNLGFTVINSKNVGILSASALDIGADLPSGRCQIRIQLPLSRFPSGQYRVEGAIWDASGLYAQSDHLASFSVINKNYNRAGVEPRGATLLDRLWAIEKTIQPNSITN